jgi:OFA family oxalate/formate antiporter-like MFS transporter
MENQKVSIFETLKYSRVFAPDVALSRRWVYLVLSALTLVFLGFLYGWSILAAPLQSSFGWTSSELAITFTISTSMFCVGGVVGAQLTKRTAPRFTMWVSALLICLGFWFSSQASQEGISLIYVAYGICVGGASGMAHNAILGCTNNWFPDRIGLSSGSLTLGFGIGSLVLGPIVGHVIETIGWQGAFIALGVATAIVVVAGAQVVRYPNPAQVLPPAVVKKPAEKIESDASGQLGSETKVDTFPPIPTVHSAKKAARLERTTVSGLNFTTRQMLRCPAFYLTFLFSVLAAAVYLGIMGNAKLIALELGAVTAIATVMVGMVSLGDGISRFVSGVSFDKFGYRKALIAVAILFIVSPLVLLAAYKFGQLWLVVAGFIILGLGFGSISTVLSAVTNRFYGPKNFGSNLSVAYLDFLPSSVMGPPLVGFIQTSTGSFQDSFVFLALFGVAALVAALFIYPPKRVPN